jgi:hypothetical protein
MATHTKRVGKKQAAQEVGFLESAAQAIGSTLGTIALKTGLATPEPPEAVKKPAARLRARKTPARKTPPRAVKAAVAKRVPRKSV